MHSCSDRENALEGLDSRKEFKGERKEDAEVSAEQAIGAGMEDQGTGTQHPNQSTATAAPGEGKVSSDENARWNLLWQVQISQLYHARRCAFYDRMAKTSDFLSIIGASTALTAIGSYFPKSIGVFGAFVVLISSAATLVVGAATMAYRHDSLRRRFCELEGKIQEDIDASATKIARWKRERSAIEIDEPPTYWALSVLCERELCKAVGTHDPAMYALPLYKRLTANLFLWRNS